jgi:photosystem II stability/assembly factor-like uncharacterized protein
MRGDHALRWRSISTAALVLATFIAVPSGSLDAQTFDEGLYDGLQWTNLGPARGGRSTAVAGSTARPMEYYFGASGGGLWKTTDGGMNWSPVTDGQINSASVGAVAVCESDPDIVYIGTGETELRGNIQQGDGLYKSTDAGDTWTHIGLTETQNVSRVRVHPTDCNTVLVAAMGKHSRANPERGVYRTTDGGDNWELVLNREGNEWTGAVDISFDPNNTDLIYASLWEAWRKSWGLSSGGEGSGLFRSTDGGDSWEELTGNKPGLPSGVIGKIGVAVSPANPDRVWALIEHAEGGIFRTDDGGETWERINQNRDFRQRAFYYSRIYADPIDENVVYALNTGMYRSNDGGETFPRRYRVPHGDNHDLWLAPDDPTRMINANDGGGNVSFNGGDTWTDQDFMTAQFYRVHTTEHEPYHVCGGQQDNSTACVASSGWNFLSAAGQLFYSVGGCESGYIASNPTDTNEFFAGCYGGSLSYFDRGTGARRAVNVWPENPMGQSAEDLVERVQWTFPIVYDRHDPQIVYTGTQKLWRTSNKGSSWDALSGDLTLNDPETVGPSGGPITKDQTGVETYATVFQITQSNFDQDVMWVGSDDGLVNISRDLTAEHPTWTNVTPPDAPKYLRINTIETSPHTPGKAYVSGIGYLVEDDRSPYVWKTEDYGESWTRITGGIPEDDFIRAVREDVVRPGLLYAASERTVYASWDDGANWQPLTLNLPTVQVSDLVVEDHDLVISTHGRSFWILRNIDPLRQLNSEVADAEFHLYQPRTARRSLDPGLEVYYHLQDEAENIRIEIVDGTGEVIQTFEADSDDPEPEAGAGGGGFGRFGRGNSKPSRDAGMNRFVWNLRYSAWTDFPGRIFWAAGPTGPMAVPADDYSVNMVVDGQAQQRTFAVGLDPRIEGSVSLADLQERFDFAMRIRDRVSEANESIIRIRDLKGQIDERMEASENVELRSLGTNVKNRLGEVEQEVYQVRNESGQDPLNFPIKLNNKLAALLNQIEGGEFAPTRQSYDVFEYLNNQLQQEMDQLKIIIQQDLGQLNELLRELGLDPIQLEDLITE